MMLCCFLSTTCSVRVPPANFVFGDSLVDAGNNNYITTFSKANHVPNGIDFPGHEPTGRYTNGRTILSGQALGLMEFTPPFLAPSTAGDVVLKGVNYASGGAGILNKTGQDIIARLGSPAASALLRTALFSVTIGANDFINNYLTPLLSVPQRAVVPPDVFVEAMIARYRHQLTVLLQPQTSSPSHGAAQFPDILYFDLAEAVSPGRQEACRGQRWSYRLYSILEGSLPIGNRRQLRRLPQPVSSTLQREVERSGGGAEHQPGGSGAGVRGRLPHSNRDHSGSWKLWVSGRRFCVLLRQRTIRRLHTVRPFVGGLRRQIQVMGSDTRRTGKDQRLFAGAISYWLGGYSSCGQSGLKDRSLRVCCPWGLVWLRALRQSLNGVSDGTD
ncbi:hypothetical protein BHM03_00026435 [Ensete ventricosum]|nr:hypothetical protein BHM03_00026435 [Ensete ventricosum]